MKRLILAALVVAAFVGIEAAPAQAYVQDGPHCILRAYVPNANDIIGSNAMSGQGEVDCDSTRNITLSVCLQQLVTGGWQNVYCTEGSSNNNSYFVSTSSVNPPVNGRWYRTTDQAWIGDGSYAQYYSSGVQG